ncbi:hypothetical protein Taro_006115 [Colocasia esculenta]|uniref:Uncharacterized protein n=1 Tax=Colocasia esculenta TaxID=4460 RepID=A0A843TZT7_COLES|nr:hypothetical protein [Colocasia esculenta]
MVLCRVRNQKKEHDEAKYVWVMPWWEQLQEVCGGNCSSSKKRKIASPRCEDAASSAQQQLRGLGQRASSKSKELQEIPVIGIMEDDSELQRQQQDVLLVPPAVSPSAAVSPFSLAASSDDKVQGFSPLTGGLGADWDELLQVAMDYYSEAASIDSHVPLLQQQEQRDVCNATLLTEPFLTDASSTLHVGAVNACSSDEDVPPISITTGAGNGCWTSNMELLYCEEDVALNVGDPCWCQYLQPNIWMQYKDCLMLDGLATGCWLCKRRMAGSHRRRTMEARQQEHMEAMLARERELEMRQQKQEEAMEIGDRRSRVGTSRSQPPLS